MTELGQQTDEVTLMSMQKKTASKVLLAVIAIYSFVLAACGFALFAMAQQEGETACDYGFAIQITGLFGIILFLYFRFTAARIEELEQRIADLEESEESTGDVAAE